MPANLDAAGADAALAGHGYRIPVNLGYYHPLVVHFAIGLLAAGVIFRLISLSGRARFTGPAAASLLLAGTLAVALAARSGRDAHAPVEHSPGNGEPLLNHQERGFQARNVFYAVAALELAALALARKKNVEKYARYALFASGIIGLGGGYTLYLAGKEGGRLVYSYAGGVGVRSGDPKDLDHLLLTALFHKAMAERVAGHRDEAAALFAEVGQRYGSDPEIALYAAESLLLDRKDYDAAVKALRAIAIPADEPMRDLRRGWLVADALEAAGKGDEAMASLRELSQAHPGTDRIDKRIARGPRPATSAAPPK